MWAQWQTGPFTDQHLWGSFLGEMPFTDFASIHAFLQQFEGINLNLMLNHLYRLSFLLHQWLNFRCKWAMILRHLRNKYVDSLTQINVHTFIEQKVLCACDKEHNTISYASYSAWDLCKSSWNSTSWFCWVQSPLFLRQDRTLWTCLIIKLTFWKLKTKKPQVTSYDIIAMGRKPPSAQSRLDTLYMLQHRWIVTDQIKEIWYTKSKWLNQRCSTHSNGTSEVTNCIWILMATTANAYKFRTREYLMYSTSNVQQRTDNHLICRWFWFFQLQTDL